MVWSCLKCITLEKNKAGRAEFVFFGIILKILNVRIGWLYYWGECIYLLNWLPSHSPRKPTKARINDMVGKEEQMYTF